MSDVRAGNVNFDKIAVTFWLPLEGHSCQHAKCFFFSLFPVLPLYVRAVLSNLYPDGAMKIH